MPDFSGVAADLHIHRSIDVRRRTDGDKGREMLASRPRVAQCAILRGRSPAIFPAIEPAIGQSNTAWVHERAHPWRNPRGSDRPSVVEEPEDRVVFSAPMLPREADRPVTLHGPRKRQLQ